MKGILIRSRSFCQKVIGFIWINAEGSYSSVEDKINDITDAPSHQLWCCFQIIKVLSSPWKWFYQIFDTTACPTISSDLFFQLRICQYHLNSLVTCLIPLLWRPHWFLLLYSFPSTRNRQGFRLSYSAFLVANHHLF